MSISVGEIVLLSGLNIHESKLKYAVCISDNPIYLFLVNSENRKMYDCIPFPKKDGRDFPRKDSFLGCKNIFSATISQVISRHGSLDLDELKAILAKIEKSKTLVRKDIDHLKNTLGAAITRISSN